MKESFSFLTTNIALAFSGLIILASIFYLIRKLAALFAAPTFAALYYVGSFTRFKFNIPKKGPKKLVMEFCGMICTAFSLTNMLFCIDQAYKTSDFEELMQAAQNQLIFESALVCICLAIIVLISYSLTPEDDDKDWFDNIMTLNFPKKLPGL
jgi:hypothetical protein